MCSPWKQRQSGSGTAWTMQPIVILSDRSPTSYLLINRLLRKFRVEAVIFEAPPLSHSIKLLVRRAKRIGVPKVISQAAFMLFDRSYIRPTSRGKIKQLLAGEDTSPPDGRATVLEVPTVNDTVAVECIGKLAPACCVVSGTSIVAKRTIERAGVILNIHCGITPRYRGVHGGFWAVWEGRPELAGVTVHQIDAGIDTGGIYAQKTVQVEPTDTYRTLPVKQYLAGAPVMEAAVTAVLNGTFRTFKRTDLESKLWYTPTISEHVRFCRMIGRQRQ